MGVGDFVKEHKSTITKVCIITESCHFNDKNSLGGSFCVWRGGSIMSTTGIMPQFKDFIKIHIDKIRSTHIDNIVI